MKSFWAPSFRAAVTIVLVAVAGKPSAQTQPVPATARVVVSGMVTDEATKSAVLVRLRDLYGADRVVDEVSVGPVVSPPHWRANVEKILAPNLKLIRKGQLVIDGTNVALKGEVANEAIRQQLASEVALNLHPTYTLASGLRVAASEQNALNQVLANRIVEFETGSANLTPAGQALLDEMAAAVKRMGNKRIEIIGHTDSAGLRDSNLALSKARADAVKNYLAAREVSPNLISTAGRGPDEPVASNATAAGRARNRRIQFRIIE